MCTYPSEYPETEIHPLVCLVKTEKGQRHWREREDPPVQTYLHECGNEGGERVRPSRKQIMADLSCDDSTGVGTPVLKGAARRDPRRGEIPVMCGQAQFLFLPWMAFCCPRLGK